MNETCGRRQRNGAHTAARRLQAAGFSPVIKGAGVGSGEELLALFDNRVLGEEEIGGRKAWVIESTPNAGLIPASRHQKEVLSFGRKLWIDEAENVTIRQVYTVIGFVKVGPDTWREALIACYAATASAQASASISA